ncbi:MAG: DUF4136 domain-containing protein [Bacteroidia bacterium]|nr:DUF4136 domain-containing protein [Bacteroidia bacterium]MBT8274532.1 DUF4136 domain-containing protein [Bacteroidia bacterium]NNK54806.1 DUF4136 domain-containing protein [Flavobacteriaceae bacterium]NNM09047.1 DUF4136 domain-containing protein [Flavobacteriaceae bacterium]
MKKLKFAPALLLVLVLTSCSTVRVVSDYDREANFDQYKTYAFYKPGVDKAEISDLDKKRILRAIDAELSAKGLNKGESPDLLVSIFTKERERVDVYNNNFGWGWGWNPWWYGGWGNTVSTSTEGSLYVDLIDAKTNELVWQGIGTARLITSGNIDKKEERIREIVREIMMQYPPGSGQN